ncbi:MAG: hypothetical protein HOD60_11265, partial [Candidatus Nitrosopelagicus sp.]|nr:hypothetical protein [Candidatus Nitrosopelagicus sp.]
STDKAQKYHTEIQKQLKKQKIKTETVYANRFRLFDIIGVVKKLIQENRKDSFYVNVASGSKIHAIGCMMACMMFDDRDNIHPFYPQADKYPVYKNNEQQTYGVKEIHALPTYQLLTPKQDLLEALKIIKEHDGRIQKKVLAEIAEERKILNIGARKENHSNARFASLDKKIIQPLLNTWGFIEEEKIGKNRWISFTDDGKNASEFLF